jgi:heterodisulfide reductase subunit A
VESGRHQNIRLITNADLKEISGSPGDFAAKVRVRPRYVDTGQCTACGTCAAYCPVPRPDPYNQYLTTNKAAYLEYTQAVPSAYAVDPDYCLFLTRRECKQCSRVCQRGAIDFDQKSEELTVEVGAIILTPGFSAFDPSGSTIYPYKESPNIVSGMEFERISNAAGPYAGKILRPSDHTKPDRIAFIQCVGSRDKATGRTYCSSVCCKYAVKDAIVALEHEPDLDITIFYMDMRMYGKGFEPFYRRAVESGVRFIRSRVSEIKRDPKTEDLILTYVPDDGSTRRERFNMVVLSTGLGPPHGNSSLALAAGISLNSFGFCQTGLFSPMETSRKGIFVAGVFQGPKAIPESVMQGSAAAASAAEILAPARGTLIKEKEFPEELSVQDEPPRIGVFVCHCGKNIAGVVDVSGVTSYAASLPDVVISQDNMYSCSQDAQTLIKETISKHRINRVVIASCTPRTHEPLFQETLREAGLNKSLLEMVNIRDQCSWVHADEKEKATRKSKDLIRMAIAKARLIQPLPELSIEIIPRALVIGGGLAGMTAALSLAHQGFDCVLVERSPDLGGNLGRIHYTLDLSDPQAYLAEVVQEVKKNTRVSVLTEATICKINGFIGNFTTYILTGAGQDARTVEVQHGIIIVSTGAKVYQPEEYLYGKNPRVILQQDLEESLAHSQLANAMRDVVMIQCVGSRNEQHPYCSSICCSQAIKNALKIKEMNPDTNVTILYRDIMTYGFHEESYRRAMNLGVTFLRYNLDNGPKVQEEGGRLRVTIRDRLLDQNIVLSPDLLVLSPAIVPHENPELVEQLNIPLSEDRFFLESHVQLKPVDSYVDGIFLCGMAQFPKFIDESLTQAKAAASKAAILLAKGVLKAEPIASTIDGDRCIACGICEHLCPYSAIRMVKVDKRKRAEVVTAACKGCGVCASYCPVRAITMGRFTDEQILAQIEAFGNDH